MSWKPRHFNAPQQAAHTTHYGMQVSSQQVSSQRYYNGAVGNEYQTNQSSNLSNSAVSRMLQENESSSIRKEVVWPPPHDSDIEDEYDDPGYNINFQSQRPSNGIHHKKPSKPFKPPPATIPLRASPPITQEAPPIFKSEPITISYQGGSRMRGDQKWPPPECRAQIEAEKEASIALARGPQFRPSKVKKDYSSFFARNALPNSYPGYKAPPGTQHYDEENGYGNY